MVLEQLGNIFRPKDPGGPTVGPPLCMPSSFMIITVKLPLCILFLYLNSLIILWLHLLWCLLLLHFRYSKISVEKKTRPRLQDEQNGDQ